MSAILDALKKSDRDRRLGQTPTLDDAPPAGKPKRRGWLLLVLFLIAVVLVAALLIQNNRWRTLARMAGVLPGKPAAEAPIQNEEIAGSTVAAPSTSQGDGAVQRGADMAGTADPAPANEPVRTVDAGGTQPGETGRAASAERLDRFGPSRESPDTSGFGPRAPTDDDAVGNDAVASQSRIPRERAAFEPAPTRPATSDPVERIPSARPDAPDPRPVAAAPGGPQSSEADPDDDYRRVYQLPLDVRRQMPTVSLNALRYSGVAEDRMVLLNMKRLYEGDELEGVRINEIRPSGVVLEYLGYEFLVER